MVFHIKSIVQFYFDNFWKKNLCRNFQSWKFFTLHIVLKINVIQNFNLNSINITWRWMYCDVIGQIIWYRKQYQKQKVNAHTEENRVKIGNQNIFLFRLKSEIKIGDSQPFCFFGTQKIKIILKIFPRFPGKFYNFNVLNSEKFNNKN